MELLRQPIRRHRQWNHPRRIFKRRRCHVDTCESTTAATSHRGCGWFGRDVGFNNDCIPDYIHHRRKDLVAGVGRQRGIRVQRNRQCSEIRANKHSDITEWTHLGGRWHIEWRCWNKLSRILSKRDSVDARREWNHNDDECARDCICSGGGTEHVRCRQRRLGCRWRYLEFSRVFIRWHQLERSPQFSHHII